MDGWAFYIQRPPAKPLVPAVIHSSLTIVTGREKTKNLFNLASKANWVVGIKHVVPLYKVGIPASV